jgi:4-hydroxythreonine-4-phosphate dehydrogenase
MIFPKIAITPGEPAGIGPDVLIQIAQQPHPAALIAFADPELLHERARQLRLPLTLQEWDITLPPSRHEISTLLVSPQKLQRHCQAGIPHKDNIPYVLNTLNAATDACMAGHCDALVTGPVNKGLFHEAGVPFSGHTEFLAERTRSQHVVMVLATKDLRIALLTTHLPLRQVPDALTPQRLQRTLSVIHQQLGYLLGKPAPKIFVLGLNPHAGDNGALGLEEQQVMVPVLEQLRALGMDLVGPCSADTAFSAANRDMADIFLAMYHDQGLPVLKTLGFGQAVNITLGLNIIRTSVDHGTAYALAGTGKAKPDSLQFALQTAIDFCVGKHSRED